MEGADMIQILFILWMSMVVTVQAAWALTGREIMANNDALVEADTGKSRVEMRIHKGGQVVRKEFEIITMTSREEGNKTLISFIKPTRIKLLTHEHNERDDDQWLRLSSGKIKRIASRDKGKSFVNSLFYYEDLTSRELDEYTYQYTGDSVILGEAAYVVEAVKKQKKRVYSKLTLYVRQSDFFIIRIDLFKKGRLQKILENHNVREVDGILTALKIVMSSATKKEKTELIVQTVNYNINLRRADFNKEALR